MSENIKTKSKMEKEIVVVVEEIIPVPYIAMAPSVICYSRKNKNQTSITNYSTCILL